jgi:hypothetical protein
VFDAHLGLHVLVCGTNGIAQRGCSRRWSLVRPNIQPKSSSADMSSKEFLRAKNKCKTTMMRLHAGRLGAWPRTKDSKEGTMAHSAEGAREAFLIDQSAQCRISPGPLRGLYHDHDAGSELRAIAKGKIWVRGGDFILCCTNCAYRTSASSMFRACRHSKNPGACATHSRV